MPWLPVSALPGFSGAVAGGRHDRLAEADAAVVARDAGVRQHREAARLQAGDRSPQEQQVLEDPAGKGNRAEAVLLAQEHAPVLDERGQAVVEAGGDDLPRHACRQVGDGRADQVRAARAEGSAARLARRVSAAGSTAAVRMLPVPVVLLPGSVMAAW